MKKIHSLVEGIAFLGLIFLILSGCATQEDSTAQAVSTPGPSVPWGITLEQFKADLRIWDNSQAIAYADEIVNGNLYVDSIITSPVSYSLDNFDWNREETTSPATFQLYLQSLGMVKFLSYAALEQSDPSYLTQAELFIESWRDYAHDPARSSANTKVWYDHASALRAENLVYFILTAEKLAFADDSLREMIRSLLIEHGDFLSSEDHYTKNHNHGIFQDEALLYIAAILMDHDLASQWTTLAKDRLQVQLDYAFTDEFVHVENSSAYCIGVIELFSKISHFLQAIDDPYGEILNENIHAMVDFYARLIMPTGYIAPTGDSFYESAHALEEDFGNAFLRHVLSDGASGEAPESLHAYYPKSGYFIAQDSYDKDQLNDATWVMFKTGYVSSTHKHADDLSILLCSKGHEIFIDPGMYNYTTGDLYRDYLISPRAHNTINVDGQTYSTTVENSTKTGLLTCRTDEGYNYVLGFNNMYPGVEIDRHFYSANDVIVLHDDIRSSAQHTYSQLFSLSESMQVLSLDPQETVLKIGETDYLVRIRQLGSTPHLTLLRNQTDENGQLYGVASDSLNEVHAINTLKYDLTGTNERFVTVITIEDANGGVKLSTADAKTPLYIQSDSITFDKQTSTLFLDQLSIELIQRLRPAVEDIHWQIQNGVLCVEPSEVIPGVDYAWSLLQKDTGKVLAHTDWKQLSSVEFALPDCDVLLEACVRDPYGQISKSIVGAWEGQNYTEPDLLNYRHTADTITQLSDNCYQFTAGLDYSLGYSLRWYVYRNGSYYSVQTISNANTFEYTFHEPGCYTVSYYIRTQSGDYEYWSFPSLQIN